MAGLVREGDVFQESMKMVDAIQSLLAGARHQFSSGVSAVNDSSAEYVVSTMKHFYDSYIIV